MLAPVLKDAPSLQALPADTPPSIRRLLRRCLEKDPVKRLDSTSAKRLGRLAGSRCPIKPAVL